MKLHTLSKNFSRAFGAGLAASLLISAPVAVYAQTNSNNSTNNLFFNNGTNANGTTGINAVSPTVNQQIVNQIQNSLNNQLQNNLPSFPSIPFPFSQKPNSDRDTGISKVAQALVDDGVTSLAARHTAVVAISVKPDETRDILASIPNQNGLALASSTGVLVASTQPVAIAQAVALDENKQSVTGLYNRYTKAFMVSGMEDTEAQSTAKNLVLALAEIKTAYVAPSKVSVKKINDLARLVEQANKALPGMMKVVSNSPNPEAFHQIKDTVDGLEIVEFYVKAVQDAG